MGDGFNDEEEEVENNLMKQQIVEMESRQTAQQDFEFMENMYDFHKYTADPNLTSFFPKLREINKNWIFGNFNNNDETIISLSENLIDDIDFLLPNRPDSIIKTSVLRDIFSRIALSRGRKGFAARLFVTQIGSTKAEISNTKQKPLLSMRRRQ